MENIRIGLEERLKGIADDNRDFLPLWDTWCSNKRILESFMQIIIGAFPHYSLHDASHSRNVINNIEMLLGNARNEQLGATDIWLLLNSAYAHDIGMISQTALRQEWSAEPFKEYLRACKEGTNGDELRRCADITADMRGEDKSCASPIELHFSVIYLLAEYQRKHHAKYSAQTITDSPCCLDLSGNGFIPRRFIEWIAKIVQSHGEDFSFILKLSKEDNGFCRDYIHPRFLAALLCLGDILDMDNSRFHPYAQLLIDEHPASSKAHIEKHEAIRQLCITPEFIEITADFGVGNPYYHESYRSLRQWCGWLRALVEKITLNWNEIAPAELGGNAPILKEITYISDGKKIKPELAELNFHISQERAFELIEGSGIYEDDCIFLRELLQNAIDASKIQFWQDIQDGCFSDKEIDAQYSQDKYGFQPYHIKEPEILDRYKIIVEFEPIEEDRIIVRVIDRGTGMSEEDILNMSDAGSSYRKQKKKRRIEAMPRWLRPTGSFGIGLQSLFLIDKEFLCTTRSRRTNEQYRISFLSRKESGYLNIYDVNETMHYGTSFEITYHNDRYFDPRSVANEITKQAFALYNEYDFLLDLKPKNTTSKIGALHLFTKLTAYMRENHILFPISIRIAGLENHTDYDHSFVQMLQGGCMHTSGNYIAYTPNSLSCNIWNAPRGYYAYINVGNRQTRDGLYFKNIRVPKAAIAGTGAFSIAIDLFGWDTEEALQVNREKLRNDFSIKEIIEEVKELWTSMLAQRIDTVLDIIQSVLKNDKRYLWYTLLMILLTDKCFPAENKSESIDKLLDLDCDYDLQGYRYSDDAKSYQFKQDISARALIEQLYHSETTVQISLLKDLSPATGESATMLLNRDWEKLKDYPIIYIENPMLNEYTRDWDDQLVSFDSPGNIYFRVKTRLSVQATELDTSEFIKHLYGYNDENDKRMVVANCISTYQALALPLLSGGKLPIEYYLGTNRLNLGFRGNEMFVPVSDYHAERIKKSPCKKENFINEIVTTPQYAKLVEFTHTHQFKTNTYSTQEIDECYRSLIGKIYDVIAAHETNN